MERSADAFKTISEVAEDLDLPQHVLRFWETRFNQIRPLKRSGGRRYYRPEDVELLRAIRHLLYGEGYTIRGVQRILKEQGVKAVIGLVRAGGNVRAPAGTAALEPAEPILVASPAQDFEEPALSSRVEPLLSMEAATAQGLSGSDVVRLRMALAEIVECARILQAARS